VHAKPRIASRVLMHACCHTARTILQVVQYLSSSQLCLAAARVVCACIRGLAYIQQNLLLPQTTQPPAATATVSGISSGTSALLPVDNGSSELQALAVGAAHAVLASRPLLSVLELPDKHVSAEILYCSVYNFMLAKCSESLCILCCFM
jgi:hypothetical protein